MLIATNHRMLTLPIPVGCIFDGDVIVDCLGADEVKINHDAGNLMKLYTYE